MSAVLKEKSDLPEGWKLKPIGEIVQPTRPRISPSDKPELPFLGMDHIEAHTMRMLGSVPAGTMKSSAVHFQPGDVLYGRLRPYLNKVFQPHFEGLCSAEFIVFPETDELDNKYLQYFLNSSIFVRHATSLNSGDRPRVKFEQFAPYEIPLPPTLEQQKRIVAKIEELFSHVDAGIEALKKAKQLLKQYRQSVLKAAVTGELTKEWREARIKDDAQGSANVAGGRTPGATKLEPASQLLERILKERRQKWEEQQLEQFKSKGKMPKDDKWKGKYKEPEPYEGKPPFELPIDWTWVYLEQLGEVIGGLTKNKKREQFELQLPYLRVANVYANELRLDDVTKIGVQESELERVLLEKGDLLVVEGNGSPEQIGRLDIWDGSIEPCVHQNHLIKVRLQEKDSGNYLTYWLSSLDGRGAILQVASSTSGLYTLSISKVSGLPIPLPPIEEQVEIHNIVSSKLSSIEHLENEIDVQLIKAEKNKQSILASAFLGEITQ